MHLTCQDPRNSTFNWVRPKRCMNRPCPMHTIASAVMSLRPECQRLLLEGMWGVRLSPNTQSGTSQWVEATWLHSPAKSWVSSGHCLAFFTMVPTAEMTVVLEPLALVVTVTTAGRVAVVVRMVGCAIVVTGMAESHLLFLFWASRGDVREGSRSALTNRTLKAGLRQAQVQEPGGSQ